jgi:hypothetical protein
VVAILPTARWQPLARTHARRADGLLSGHRERSARGEPHPVEDFLFTYYSLRPGGLRRWHPGAGRVLLGAAAEDRLGWPGYTRTAGGVGMDAAAFLARRAGTLRHVRALLAATAARPPGLGCFGLHEWAMVYRDGDRRHRAWPLRLGQAGSDEVVRTHRIRCTHHDAYRFFTDAARPLNAVRPGREDQVALEQPGCLHATMDLYKWAYKLAPAVPGELLLDCFELARDARAVDMRASPYDLTELGYPPIAVETAAGKAAYVAAQRALAARAAPLRARLMAACDAVVGAAWQARRHER